MKRRQGAICSLVILLALSTVAYAAIRFEVTVDRRTISLGESAQLNLSFYGTQNVSAPDIGKIEGFQVRYLGPSTRMSIINGQVSTSITHIYTLIPLKTGTFTIDPISVSYQGETLTSEPIIIEVVSGRPGSQIQTPKSDSRQETIPQEQLKDRIFLTIEADKTHLYVNEVVPLSIKLYIDSLAVRDIQYPRFEHEGFYVGEFDRPQQYREGIGGITYDVIEFNTQIFAVRPGKLSLGPAQIDCNLIVRKQRRHRRSAFDDDFFSSFFDDDIFDRFFGLYEAYPFQVTSLPLKITVLPLPQENKPSNFKGAVGSFQLEVEVSPKEIRAGDPVTLKMTVRGRGNFDTVSSPILDSEEGFKIYQPQVKQEDSVKVFEQVLIPESETISEIPRVSFSFFNPETETYHTLTKGPFPITVTKPEGGELKIVDIPQAVTRIPEKEPLGRDIVYIKESPGTLQPIGTYLYKKLVFWFYQMAVFGIFIFLIIFHKHQERLKTDERYARRLAAPAKARKGIVYARQLLTQEKSGEFFDVVHRTIREYLADKLHLPQGRITVEAVKKILSTKNVEEGIFYQKYLPLQF